MSVETPIEKAVRKFWGRCVHHHEPCRSVSLHEYINGKGMGSALHVHETSDPQDYRRDVYFDKVIEEFCEAAQENTDGVGHICQYVLKAEWDDKPSICSNKFRVTVSEDAVTEEEPNDRGMLSQLMRHNEAIMRQLVSMANAMGMQSAHTIGALKNELEDERKFKLKFIKKYEQLEDRKQERDLELRREERKEQQMAQIASGVTALLPGAVGKLLGVKGSGAEVVRGTPQYQALKSIFQNMSKEQLEAMPEWLANAPLGEMERSALIDIVQSIGEATDERESKNVVPGPWK